jgi:hypothetical protein
MIHSFKISPFLLGVYKEKEDRNRLRKSVRVMGNNIKGNPESFVSSILILKTGSKGEYSNDTVIISNQ